MCESSYSKRLASNSLFSKTTKRVSWVLLSILIASIGAFFSPRLYAAYLTYIHPDKNILVNRSLEPDDLSAVSNGDTITITIDVTNNEDVALRGFYYSDQVPNGWQVSTVDVSVNGASVADYTYAQGSADEIYTDFTPHRWALELPQGNEVFSPSHSIPASSGTAQIVYAMIVNGGTGGDYSLEHDGWAGWLETEPAGTAVFGYQDIATPLSADFTAEPRDDVVPLTVQFNDLSTGDPTAWTWSFGDDSPINFQQHPTHTYTIPDTYTVTLTITRTDPMESDTVVKPNFITVTVVPLQANFSAQPRFGLPSLDVQFTDLSTGDILTRVWDFGDGGTVLLLGTALSPGPTYTYTSLGYYTVSLTVQDAYGVDTLVRPQYIHVTDVIYNVYLPVILKIYVP